LVFVTTTPRLLITGASGFLGGALAARLIQTDQWDECLFLIRGLHREDGLARLAHVLRGHDIAEHLLNRLRLDQIICGSLNTVTDWQDDHRIPTIVKVVNSAAVASFGNHPSIWPTNVDGVLAMAHALAKRCTLQRFLHIGTAMACGRNAPIPVPEGYDAQEKTDHFLEYTASKYEAEHRLREELPDLPLIVARPSIVVGHTKFGCKPSGSIFWVFRIARALKCFPCELSQRIDVIPADYCAEALHLLLDKPKLQHTTYHITAGTQHSCSFDDIDRAIADAIGQAPMGNHYQPLSVEEISKIQGEFKTLLGPCNRRIVLRAIRTYGEFAKMEMLFDNQRLLTEGMGNPTPLTAYAGLCEQTSFNQSIAEQMKFDYK
jgi:nucleoside-diphosphate-sugar epimerase